MTDQEFDAALIDAAFHLAASAGWNAVSPAAAARAGGLALERARARFPTRDAILLRFGGMADAHAMTGALERGQTRERLFDVVMRRFDALQQHRAGVLSLLGALPANPGTALLLAAATTGSMGWMLEAAGVPATGWRGRAAAQGMVAVWMYTLRTWCTDDSPDLSATMAALDRALSQAERVAGWLQAAPKPDREPNPFPNPEPADAEALAGVISGAADPGPT